MDDEAIVARRLLENYSMETSSRIKSTTLGCHGAISRHNMLDPFELQNMFLKKTFSFRHVLGPAAISYEIT